MKWPEVPLSKVAEINPSRPRNLGIKDDQPVSFVPMPAVSEQTAAIEHPDMHPDMRPYVDVKKGFTYFEENDVLLAKITPCMENGKSAMASGLIDGVGFGSTEFHVIRSNQFLLLPKYVHYFVRQQSFRNNAKARMRGAVGQQRVPKNFLNDTIIPLPPISEQHRIVEILDQADRLRKLRADADAKAQRILPALFIKMFGDPVANRKNWPIEKFGNVGTLERGKSKHRPRNDPVLLGGTHPLIQTGDVANSGGRISNYTQTYSDVGLSQSRMWPSGTLCITIAANIAKTGILEFDACFPDSIVGFHPDPYVTTEYVQSWLWFLQPVLENSAPQAAQKNINLQVLRALPIPIPPKKLQKKFSKQANDLNNQENNMQKVSSSIEKIFRSLLYRAFTGNLTASWREAHMKELLQEMKIQAKALAS